MPYDRETWDLTSVLQAIEPDNNYFNLSEKGTITIDSIGPVSYTHLFKALISLVLMLIKIILNISKMKSWHMHQLLEIMRWLPRTKVVMQTIQVLS